MNLSYVAHAGVTRAPVSRARGATRGELRSRCVPAFSAPSVVHRRSSPRPDRYGVAAVDALFKSTGEPNYNAVALRRRGEAVPTRRLRRSCATWASGAIVRAEAAAYTVWAEPGDDLLQLRPVRTPIAALRRLVRPVRTAPPRGDGVERSVPVHGRCRRVPRRARRLPRLDQLHPARVVLDSRSSAGWSVTGEREPGSGCAGACARSGLVVIVFSTLVGNALDFRENNRFRVETAPVVLVLGALGLELIWRRAQERRLGA